MIYNFPVICFI